jgi:hypothetical protein
MTKLGGFLAIALALTAVPAMGQSGRPPIESALLLGPSPYDLSGTGTGFAVNAGVAVPVLRQVLLLEPSLGIFTYTSQFGNREHWLFPELGLQAQARVGAVRPYLGGGIGAGTVGLSGPARWKFTLHGLAGVRAHLSGRWGIRGEMRIRSVDPFHGNTVDFGLGVTRTSF